MPKKPEITDDSLFAISVPYKCSYKWKDMKGNDRVRECSACEKNVFNISNLTRQEAIDLIKEKEGNLCVTFYQRRDGTVITKDCASVLGEPRIKTKYHILAIVHAGLAFIFNLIAPMIGPALCTIVTGGMGPILKEPSSIASDSPRTTQPGQRSGME